MPIVCYTFYTPISKSPSAIYQQEHTLGLQLLQKGLEHFYHISLTLPEIESYLLRKKNGKPYLKDYPEIFFNISHCPGLVVCAFHSRPIGADCELPDRFAPILLEKILSSSEQELFHMYRIDPRQEEEYFFRFWTLKEAYVKYSGIGVDTDLTAFSFFFHHTNEQLQITCSDPAVTCFQHKMENGQILSLCFETSPKDISSDLELDHELDQTWISPILYHIDL